MGTKVKPYFRTAVILGFFHCCTKDYNYMTNCPYQSNIANYDLDILALYHPFLPP